MPIKIGICANEISWVVPSFISKLATQYIQINRQALRIAKTYEQDLVACLYTDTMLL